MKTRWLTTMATVGLTMIAALAPAVADQPATTGDASAPIGDTSHSAFAIERTTPPDRPLPLTVEQAGALERLATQPEYRIDPDTRAAFSPETQKKITEASSAGFYGAYFGSLIILLVAAAPL